MPFTHLSWNAPQAMVVASGVTFILQPVEIGANQVPLPIGDPHPITCGAFECAMGMDAPEVTIENSMACTMWEPTLELDVGLIDNSLSQHTGRRLHGGGDNRRRAADAEVTEVTILRRP